MKKEMLFLVMVLVGTVGFSQNSQTVAPTGEQFSQWEAELEALEQLPVDEQGIGVLFNLRATIEDKGNNPAWEPLRPRTETLIFNIQNRLYASKVQALHGSIDFLSNSLIELNKENKSAADTGFWMATISGTLGIAGFVVSYILGSEKIEEYRQAYYTEDITPLALEADVYNYTAWGIGSGGALGAAFGLAIMSRHYDTTDISELKNHLERLETELIERLEMGEPIPVFLERELKTGLIDANEQVYILTGIYDPELTRVIDLW